MNILVGDIEISRTNDSINKREFAHRINALRWEIKKKRRLYSGEDEFTTRLSKGEIKEYPSLLRSWERQYKEMFGRSAPKHSLKKVLSESGIDD